jgi:site-specific recombinase XerD
MEITPTQHPTNRQERAFLRRDGKQWKAVHVSHLFKRHVRRRGVNERLHFHSLRSTFASWLVQDGVSLYEVQKFLGHSNIAVTLAYSLLQPE